MRTTALPVLTFHEHCVHHQYDIINECVYEAHSCMGNSMLAMKGFINCLIVMHEPNYKKG